MEGAHQVSLTVDQKQELVRWLESAEWWKELPYLALEAKLEAKDQLLVQAKKIIDAATDTIQGEWNGYPESHDEWRDAFATQQEGR